MIDPRKAGKSYRLEARNPYGDTRYNVLVTEATMDSARARGPGACRELMVNVPHVLIQPSAVFRGVRERGENLWLCYAGHPDYYYDSRGQRLAAPENEIFLVFVTEKQIVYTHRWEDADLENADSPRDYNDRFDKRLRHNDSPGVDG